MIARLAHYTFTPDQLREGPDGLSDLGRRLRDSIHAARARGAGYDPRLRVAFLFLDRERGEALAFSVAERRRVTEMPSAADPPFLLGSGGAGAMLAVTLTEAPDAPQSLPGIAELRRYELEYLFLRDEPTP